MKKYPARPEQFKMRTDRMINDCKRGALLFKIPPICAFECKMLLESYYGGAWRMLWVIFKESVYLAFRGYLVRLRIRFCDWMGWTKIYDVPETATMRAYKMRHGRKCSGSPNCNNHRCIDDSVPMWFKRLTFWGD